MHVVFVEPAFPKNQAEFARALSSSGAKVTAIGEAPLQALPGGMRRWLHAYEQVPTVVNESLLYQTVKEIQEREPVDRIEATVEAHILPVAKVREACGIPGTSVRTAFLCRDKPAMKEALRQAGVPTAQSTGASSWEEAREFAGSVGYPLILKPRDAAGAAGTYRVDDDTQLEQAAQECGLAEGMPTAIEEFIEGHEGFYDTLCLRGEPAHDFMCHYYPGVLEAMRTRWISPQILCTNRIDDAADYDEIKEMGRKVIEVLGIETSATHMEWFYGPKGLKFSEIGCRPPGVLVWDIYGAANDFNLYEEWAKAIVHGKTDTKASRRFSTGLIALRPDRDGTVLGYDNAEFLDELGDVVIDYHLPPPGSKTRSIEGGYMANAWARMRHPDYDELRRLMDRVGETVKMRAQ